ncbi:MAG: ribosome-associated heat shock protein Hsp15 [Verrucomicrobiales bacterium]|jgi:ribosome-associated heat shock protein Hsp15
MSEETSNSDSVRLDAWLYAVRVFKTRVFAAQACRKGQVKIRGVVGKPARQVRNGDEIEVERVWVTLKLRVVALLSRRVAAKAVSEFCEDITPEEEIAKAREWARVNREGAAAPTPRGEGSGRPTKKERRELDELENSEFAFREELFDRWTRKFN